MFEMFAATGNPLFKGRKEPAANLNAFPFTSDTNLFDHVSSEGDISNASTSLVPAPPKPQGSPGISALFSHFMAEDIAVDVPPEVSEEKEELNAIWAHMMTSSTQRGRHDIDKQQTPALPKAAVMDGETVQTPIAMHTLLKADGDTGMMTDTTPTVMHTLLKADGDTGMPLTDTTPTVMHTLLKADGDTNMQIVDSDGDMHLKADGVNNMQVANIDGVGISAPPTPELPCMSNTVFKSKGFRKPGAYTMLMGHGTIRSKNSGIIKRKAHEVVHATRGSMDKMMAVARSKEAKDEAFKKLMDLFYTPGTKCQRNAAWSSWTRCHKAWFNSDDVLPLKTYKVYAIGALFRAGGYRSFDNYASAARQMHIEHGYEFNDALNQAMTRTVRAVNRGAGPGEQTGAFDFERYCDEYPNHEHDRDPVIIGGPIWPTAMIILGCMFLMREAELAHMKIGDVITNEVTQVVTWVLTMSKTDPSAKTCKRQWGCLCRGIKKCPFCPYCIAKLIHDTEKI